MVEDSNGSGIQGVYNGDLPALVMKGRGWEKLPGRVNLLRGWSSPAFKEAWHGWGTAHTPHSTHLLCLLVPGLCLPSPGRP